MISHNGNRLDLNNLGHGLPAITPNLGKAFAEAGAVCLEDQGHTMGVAIAVIGDFNDSFQLYWPQVDDRMRRCHNDPQEATEWGACGIAILLIRILTSFTIIERSFKGTGIDYWLGHEDDDLPFQNKARLEISGIRNGSNSEINSRVRQKLSQTTPSDGSLPAFVVVVEFGNPLSKVKKK
jgi:hypothetical protein